MDTTVIIGAGCSAGLGHIPTDYTFLGECQKEIEKSYFLLSALNLLYGRNWKDERLEICWNEIDENFNSAKPLLNSKKIDAWFQELISLAESEISSEYKYYHHYLYSPTNITSPYQYLFLFAGWELRKIIVNRCNIAITPHITKKYLKLIDKVRDLSDNKDPFAYVSFNYDVLLDSVLENKYYVGLGQYWALHHRQTRTPLIKPHGSINWLHTKGTQNNINPQESPIPSNKIGFRQDHFLQHSVIGLVGNKREFSDNEEDKLVRLIYRDRILSQLSSTISQSKQIIIIGYSFPINDTHIRAALSNINLQNLEKVLLIDKCSNIDNQRLLVNKVKYILNIDEQNIHAKFIGVENWIN